MRYRVKAGVIKIIHFLFLSLIVSILSANISPISLKVLPYTYNSLKYPENIVFMQHY